MRKKGIPEFNIAVLGVQRVGKSSLIQRFLNNSFSANYQPTPKIELYTKVFDLKEQKQGDPQLCILNIYDIFPTDHPILMADQKVLNASEKNKAFVMNQKLMEVIDNQRRWLKDAVDQEDAYFYETPEPGSSNLKNAIHGYMFVYSVDDPQSISQAKFLWELVRAKESAKMKHVQGKVFRQKMILVGNKKDNRYGVSKLQNMFDKDSEELKFLKSLPVDQQLFASAMTNFNVTKVFKKLCERLFEERDVVKLLERREKVNPEEYERAAMRKRSEEGGGFFSCCGGRSDKVQKRKSEEQKNNALSEEDEEYETSDKPKASPTGDEKKKGSGCAIF